MPGDGYKPAGGPAFKWGCATAALAAIPLVPIATIGAAMGDCAPDATCINNDWFIFVAIALCALIGLAVGSLVHAITRKRDD